MMTLLLSLAVLLAYMTMLFALGLYLRNNAIADIGYGIAFIVVTLTTLFQTGLSTPIAGILIVLPVVWGLRLAIRIFRKNYGKPEDFRYRAWREAWGRSFVVRSFFQVYMLQGLVVFTVASPILLALVYPAPPTILVVVLGTVLWLVGFFFEAVGDHQLDRFITDPSNKGKIMMRGLWRYSRHPNYFGESTMWVGIAVISAGLSAVPLVGFISPFLITFLLLRVSGVPLLEKHFESNPEWASYKARTSVFIPRPPRAASRK